MPYLSFNFKSERDGDKRKIEFKIDPEDVIAAGAVFVALIFAVAIVFGSAPINKYTVGIVGFSGAGGIVAGIVKARRSKATKSPWLAWILIVLLLAAFGIYVWASWGWVTGATK
jgi:uncharacterized RDD family membrane protein YckC